MALMQVTISGFSVSSAGDVNGDGIDDIIIGAYVADPDDAPHAGESYVVFGSSEDWSEALDLSDLNGTNGFIINGIDEDDYSGRSVSSAGDVNGDGIDDIIIGAHYADPDVNPLQVKAMLCMDHQRTGQRHSTYLTSTAPMVS